MTIRTRFSPSPTGNLHLGGVRTTLFSALYAAKHQGTFILRIEDTDTARSTEAFAASQQEDLRWLNINWQEGPGVEGAYGPYWQSQRQAIYQKYYAQLEQLNLIYPCFCSDQELLLARKLQLARGLPPRYQGTCRNLTTAQIAEKIAQGKNPAWRFIVPKDEIIEFEDLVKGTQRFLAQDMGDFIIRRADGTAPFLFCNAIDDALMKVTHVLRGEDHLANTPRQIMLLKALQLPIAAYGHLSLIVGSDGAKLSKRHGDFSVREIRDQGYLAIAIINYLARLGHSVDTTALLPFTALAEFFNIDKLSRSPARFDVAQLHYWQKMAVQSLTTQDFWHWVGERVANQVPQALQTLFAETVKMNITLPEEALMWAKIFFHDNVSLTNEDKAIIHEAGEQFFVEAEQAVEQFGTALSPLLTEMKKTLQVNGKKLYMPLRLALTGKTSGPELQHIAELLGKDKMKHRLSRAFALARE